MGILYLPRQVFLNEYFDYQPGEHVSLIEPTQGGKTHLAYQMLDVAHRRQPHLRIASMMPKPRSPATWRWARELGYKVTDSWPPPKPILGDPPPGYVFWPKHLRSGAPAENRAHLAAAFRAALAAQYRQGDSITLADDVYNLAVILGLNMDLEEFWTAGSEGGAGLWAPNQKPSGTIGGGSVSSFSYNAPTHLLLGKDTDARNVRRFSEIGGGVDPQLVTAVVSGLKRHQIGNRYISEKLYIHKGGPYMAIVGP